MSPLNYNCMLAKLQRTKVQQIKQMVSIHDKNMLFMNFNLQDANLDRQSVNPIFLSTALSFNILDNILGEKLRETKN